MVKKPVVSKTEEPISVFLLHAQMVALLNKIIFD